MISPTPWKPFRGSLGSVDYMRHWRYGVCHLRCFSVSRRAGETAPFPTVRFTPAPPHTHTFLAPSSIPPSYTLYINMCVCAAYGAEKNYRLLRFSECTQSHTCRFLPPFCKYDINRSLFPYSFVSSFHIQLSDCFSYVSVYAFPFLPCTNAAVPVACLLLPKHATLLCFAMRVPNWIARFARVTHDRSPSAAATRRRMSFSPTPRG